MLLGLPLLLPFLLTMNYSLRQCRGFTSRQAGQGLAHWRYVVTSTHQVKAKKDDPRNANLMSQHHKQNALQSDDESSSKNRVMTLDEHVQHQRAVFDQMSDIFATKQTITPELLPVYRHLAKQICDSAANNNGNHEQHQHQPLRILDVACGSGALFPFLLQQNNKVNIVGVHVARKMVQAAQQQAASLATTDQIHVVESDIIHYKPNQLFDVVIFNACFGNFWNTHNVLSHADKHLVHERGAVVVSHPLGAEFVQRLHQEDPVTVPHLLPTTKSEWNIILQNLNLQLETLQLTLDGEPYYLATLRKVTKQS